VAIARGILDGLPDDYRQQTIDALARAYRNAANTLRMEAERRLLSDRRVLTASAKQSRRLLLDVETILQQLDEDAAKWLATEIPNGYRVGARMGERGLGEIGFVTSGLKFDGNFHGTALQTLILDAQDLLLQATDGIRRNFRTVLRRTQLARATDKAITENIAEGLIAGKTRREVSKDIVQTLLRDFSDKPLTIGGRNYDIEKYAKMVARTKTREAVTAGTVNRMIETGNDLVMVTGHGATDGCGFYEGRVFSISGTHEKYPPLSQLPNGGPPFHPNCRHNLAPFVDELASKTEIRRAQNIDKRALGKPYREVEKLAAA
jgi:hypothetical protein